jgi:hypothetical protein
MPSTSPQSPKAFALTLPLLQAVSSSLPKIVFVLPDLNHHHLLFASSSFSSSFFQFMSPACWNRYQIRLLQFKLLAGNSFVV